MGKIPDGSFIDWQDTQVVSASAYKQEREMLRVAINDNDTKITNSENEIAAVKTRATNLETRTTNLELDSDSSLRADINMLQETTVKKLDTGAFFGKGENSYDSGFFIFPVNQWITEIDSDLYQTSGPENIIFKKGGLYLVNFDVTRSDLLANQSWAIGLSINNAPATLLQSEIITGQYGWSQSGGPNLSKIPAHLSHIVRVNANDYINFNNSSQDGPRSYSLKFSVLRIAD
jgi:hypothetical protein